VTEKQTAQKILQKNPNTATEHTAYSSITAAVHRNNQFNSREFMKRVSE